MKGSRNISFARAEVETPSRLGPLNSWRLGPDQHRARQDRFIYVQALLIGRTGLGEAFGRP